MENERRISQVQKSAEEYSWGDLLALVGTLSEKVAELTTEVTLLKASHITSANNATQRIQELEELQPITRSQASAIRKAIRKRVNELIVYMPDDEKMLIDFMELYRGAFISRLYYDAKNNGIMPDSYLNTPRRDFDRAMEYIKYWYPEVEGGAQGYMDYLDTLHDKHDRNLKHH